jgi:hypothetical protein
MASIANRVFDSSAVREHMDCPRKYYFSSVRHWKFEAPNKHLEFGTAWHLAKEHLILNGMSGKTLEEAYLLFLHHYRQFFTPAEDVTNKPKNPEGCMMGLEQVAERWEQPLEVFGTEMAGQVPIGPERLWAFKIDALIRDSRGVFIIDHKTASRLDANWADSFLQSVQMQGYIWAVSYYFPELLNDFKGVHVEGTVFRARDAECVDIFVKRDELALNEWLFQVNHQIDLIQWSEDVLAESEPTEPFLRAYPKNTEACTKYGRCPYMDICLSGHNPLAMKEPPIGFEVREWNPLAEEAHAKVILRPGEKPHDTLGGEDASRDDIVNGTDLPDS